MEHVISSGHERFLEAATNGADRRRERRPDRGLPGPPMAMRHALRGRDPPQPRLRPELTKEIVRRFANSATTRSVPRTCTSARRRARQPDDAAATARGAQVRVPETSAVRLRRRRRGLLRARSELERQGRRPQIVTAPAGPQSVLCSLQSGSGRRVDCYDGAFVTGTLPDELPSIARTSSTSFNAPPLTAARVSSRRCPVS